MEPERISLSNSGDTYIHLPGLSLGTTLQIKFEGLSTARTSLIGMNAGKFLLCETPPLADIRSKLYQKNHTTIRYICSGQVYGFRCTLLELIKSPYRLSILSYPEAVEHINLRRHERISSNIAAECTAGSRQCGGTITDISMGGCSFEFRKTDDETLSELGVNGGVLIAVHFNKTTAEPTIFSALIRTISIDSNRIVMGLQFSKSSHMGQDMASEKDLQDYLFMQISG